MTLSPFLRFAIVGALGFLVDIAVLWAGLNLLHLDPYSGRLLSFAVTVSFTWALNRHVTFGAARARTWRGMAHEWVRFVAVNSIGLAVNYVVYALLIGFGEPFSDSRSGRLSRPGRGRPRASSSITPPRRASSSGGGSAASSPADYRA